MVLFKHSSESQFQNVRPVVAFATLLDGTKDD